MQTLLLLMAKIVLLMGIGYFLKKKNIMTDAGQQSMTGLLLNVVLPMMMLTNGVISIIFYCLLFVSFLSLSKPS